MTSPAQQPGSSWDTRFDWMIDGNNWIGSGSSFASIALASPDQLKADPSTQVLQDVAQRFYLTPQPGSTLLLQPVGVGAAGETGDIRVWLYSAVREIAAVRTGPAGQFRPYAWHGMLACETRFTLGTKTGIAGGPVPATARYADTLADTGQGKVLGTDAIKFYQASTPNDDGAILAIDCLGAQRIGIDLRRESIGATGTVNVLARWIGSG